MALPLPPLIGRSAIDPQNVSATGVIYAAYELDQMKAFAVTDRIVQMSQQGMLPVSRTSASRALSRYWQNMPPRLTESERRAVYRRVLGQGGDQHGPEPNRGFNDLWMRFVSAVAGQRASRVRQPARRTISQTELRKRARDLAANLSVHGYGVGHFVATDLQNQIKAATNILSLPELHSAFGARDMWQVVERVSANDLGGAVNVARHRTMATSGLEIIRWLAAQHGSGRGAKKTAAPGRALVTACEAWLAASATGDGEGGENG